jgi:membrane protein
MKFLPGKIGVVHRYLRKDIWEFDRLKRKGIVGFIENVLRIGFVCIEGILKNGLFSRAAALCYSTLIAMGPLLAIIVIISSAFWKERPQGQIKEVLMFVAPSLRQYLSMTADPVPSDASAHIAESAEAGVPSGELSNALDMLITQISEGASKLFENIDTRGKSFAGFVGAAALILVGIQLLTTIETTFNLIWGVRRGRGWGQRVVFYWTFISLGAVLGLGAFGLFSASTIASVVDIIPWGGNIEHLLLTVAPFVSFGMVVLLLFLFYQFFPNTRVKFLPALIGAICVACLLFINNISSILYINYVVRIQNLYGSVGIIPVLMVGLYFFWVFILTGGQLTYAIQNAVTLSHQQAWENISPRTRFTLTLATYLKISRAYLECQKAPTDDQLALELRVPHPAMDGSISLLEEMDCIRSVSIVNEMDAPEWGYVPSQPLSRITLGAFMDKYEQQGGNPISNCVYNSDPVVSAYFETIRSRGIGALSEENLEAILLRLPFAELKKQG